MVRKKSSPFGFEIWWPERRDKELFRFLGQTVSGHRPTFQHWRVSQDGRTESRIISKSEFYLVP